MATTKIYASKGGAKAQVAFMRLGTANGSDRVVRLQRGMQVLYEDWPMCSITATAGHTSGITPATIRYGQPWMAVLVPDVGYGITSVTVTMGGTDITSSVYSNNTISIPYVSGDVAITIDDSNVVNTSMFTSRTTADGLTLLNDKALLKGIRGNSGVFYQQWYYGGTLNYNTENGRPSNISVGTGTTASAMSYSAHFKNVGSAMIISIGSVLTVGHKYLISFAISFPNATINRARVGVGYASTKGWFRSSTAWYTLANNRITGSSISNCTYNIAALEFDDSYNWCPEGGIDFEIEYINFIDLTMLFGEGNEPTTVAEFRKFFPTGMQYDRQYTTKNNKIATYVSQDDEDNTLQTVTVDVTSLTGKLNGEGESVTIFGNGMKSSCFEAINDTFDEIKMVDGVWKAYKRIGDTKTQNETSGRSEYDLLDNEEVYVLDDQTIPTELTVVTGGTESITPVNDSAVQTMPPILEIQYGAEPSRGGLLGAKGGDDEPVDDEGETEDEPKNPQPLSR